MLYCSLWNKTKTDEFPWQSVEPQETIPLSAFQQKHRPRQPTLFSPPKFVPSLGSPNPELVRYSIQGGSFLNSMGKTLWYLKKFLSVFTNVQSIRIFTIIIISTFYCCRHTHSKGEYIFNRITTRCWVVPPSQGNSSVWRAAPTGDSPSSSWSKW